MNIARKVEKLERFVKRRKHRFFIKVNMLLKIVSKMSRDNLNEINVVAKRTSKYLFAHIQIVNQLSLQLYYCIFAYFTWQKCYEQIVSTWYIRDLTRQLRDYLKYCSKCQINRIKRHQSHDSLQFILSSIIFFHTFNLNFIFALSISRVEQFNVVISITCKFTKRIIIVLNKNIWTIVQWNRILLNQFDFDDWKLFKMLIFDRDRKFMKNL